MNIIKRFQVFLSGLKNKGNPKKTYLEIEKFKVSSDDLKYECNLKKTHLENVKPNEGFIGQKRAAESLKFGIELNSPGYNIFAAGISGTEKTSSICRFLEEFAQKQGSDDLKDFCYVYNFKQPLNWRLLIFPKGQGKDFKNTIAKLKRDIMDLLANEEEKKAEIERQYNERLNSEFQKMEEFISAEANKRNFYVKENEDKKSKIIRFSFIPKSRENPDNDMSKEEFDSLPAEELEKINQSLSELNQMVQEKLDNFSQWTQRMTEGINKFFAFASSDSEIKKVIQDYFAKITYEDLKVNEFLHGLKEFALKNIDKFKPKKAPQDIMGMFYQEQSPEKDVFLKFEVSLALDNGDKTSVPVIFESHPTFARLFGKIGKEYSMGAYYTDHTMIMAGALMSANGGYLVLNALDVLSLNGWSGWMKLERSLKSGSLKIEDLYEYAGYNESNSLHPDIVPLNVKVILIGEPWVYRLLAERDSEFLDVFKVKVEFDDCMELNNQNLESYLAFILSCNQEEKLLPFDERAIEKLIEYAVTIAEDKQKISTQFGKIRCLMVESDYWAKKEGKDKIEGVHVAKAIDEQRKRICLEEKHHQEYINRGMILIKTDEEVVGQMNALSFSGGKDFSSGHPIRVDAETFLGQEGIINIQRKAKMDGPIHGAAIEIIGGWLKARYGQDKILSFSAVISFEQNYGGIEGDSASIAETAVLISSLTKLLGIKQCLAVTGSMNMKGEIQPIGGVIQKVEGWFDICQRRGLNGRHGVVIPKINIDKLILKEEIIKAVKNNKFNIYSVEAIEEALEILIGRPIEEIDAAVNRRLIEFNRIIKGK